MFIEPSLTITTILKDCNMPCNSYGRLKYTMILSSPGEREHGTCGSDTLKIINGTENDIMKNP